MFNVLEQLVIDERVTGRIPVIDPHDALAMTEQLTDSPGIQIGTVPANAMDLGQVIAEGVGTRHVQVRQLRIVSHPEEIFVMAYSVYMLDQNEKLVDVSEGQEVTVIFEGANVE